MATNIFQYTKNVAKSVVYAAADELKEISPVTEDFIDTNKEVINTVYKTMRDLRTTKIRVTNAINRSKYYDAAEAGMKAVFEDIKTGNFYNKERTRKFESQAANSIGGGDDSFDMSFGDFEFGNDDFNFNTGGDEGTVDPLEESIVMSSRDNAEAVSNTIAKATSVSIGVAKANTMLLFNQQVKSNALLEKGFTSILDKVNEVGSKTYEATRIQAENSKKFYETTTTLLQAQNSMMQQMLEMQKAATSMGEKKESPGSGVRYDDVVSYKGNINIKNYLKNIKDNALNTYPLSMLKDMGSMMNSMGDNPWMMLAASPLSFIPKAIVKGLIPKVTKKAIEDFNTTLGNAFSGILANFNKMQGSDNELERLIGEIFGVRTAKKNALDTASYNKGAMPYNGLAQKSLVEVIPGYLSRIESLLSGEGERVYNFGTGKWTSRRDLRKDHDDIDKNAYKSAYADVYNQMQSLIKSNIAFNEEELKKLNENMNNFLTTVMKEDYGNPKFNNESHKDMHNTFKYGMTSDVNQEQMLRLLIEAFQATDRNARSSLSRKAFQARNNAASRYNRLYAENPSMVELFNDSDYLAKLYQWKKDSHGDPTIAKKAPGNIYNQAIDKVIDDRGHNLFWYLQRMYAEMVAFRQRGYSGPGGGPGPGGGNPPSPSGTGDPNLDTLIPLSDDERLRRKRASSLDSSFQDRINEYDRLARERGRLVYGSWGFSNADMERAIAMMRSDSKKAGSRANYQEYLNSTRVQNEIIPKADDFFGTESYNRKQKKAKQYEEILERAVKDTGKSKEDLRLLDKLLAAENVSERLNVVTSSVQGILESPTKLFTNVMLKADERLYNLVFGDEKGEVHILNGKPVKSVMSEMVYQIKNTFGKVNDWITEKVLNPLKEAGINGPKGFFKWIGKQFGIDLDGSGHTLKNWITGFVKDFRDQFKGYGTVLRNFFKNTHRDRPGDTSTQQVISHPINNRNDERTKRIKASNKQMNDLRQVLSVFGMENQIDEEVLDQQSLAQNFAALAQQLYGNNDYNNITDVNVADINEFIAKGLSDLDRGTSISTHADLKSRMSNAKYQKFIADAMKYASDKKNAEAISIKKFADDNNIDISFLKSLLGDDTGILNFFRQRQMYGRASVGGEFTGSDSFGRKLLRDKLRRSTELKNLANIGSGYTKLGNISIDKLIASGKSPEEIMSMLETIMSEELTQEQYEHFHSKDTFNKFEYDDNGNIAYNAADFNELKNAINRARFHRNKRVDESTADAFIKYFDKMSASDARAFTDDEKSRYTLAELRRIAPDAVRLVDGEYKISNVRKLIDAISNEQSFVSSLASGAKYVTKTGLTTIHEGEMVIPSELNPYNPRRGKVSKATEVRNENRVKRSFLNSLSRRIGSNAAGTAGVNQTTVDETISRNFSEFAAQIRPATNDAYRKQVNNDGSITYYLADDDNNWTSYTVSKEDAIANGLSDNPNVIDFPTSDTPVTARHEGKDIVKTLARKINRAIGDEGFKKLRGYMKKEIPATAAGGAIGGLAGLAGSLALGIPGGPLIGAAIGAVGNLARNSETVSRYLFGDIITDEYGNEKRAGGLISAEFQEGFKKFAPNTIKGTGIGAIIGSFTPFGPLGGAVLGTAVGLVSRTEEFSGLLFGEDGIFTEEQKEKFKKALPKAGLGAGIGALTGLLGNPLGIVGGALLGAATGFASTSDKFKDIIFGKETEVTDANGNKIKKRQGGVVGAIAKLTIEPLKETAIFIKDNVKEFVKKDLIGPLKNAAKPLANAFKNALTGIKDGIVGGINNFFENKFGVPLTDMIKDRIITPLSRGVTKLMMAPFKLMGGILSAPFKLLGWVGNNIRGRQIMKGKDLGSTAAERNEWRDQHKFRTGGFGSAKLGKVFRQIPVLNRLPIVGGFLSGERTDQFRSIDQQIENTDNSTIAAMSNSIAMITANRKGAQKAINEVNREIQSLIMSKFDDQKGHAARIFKYLKKDDPNEWAKAYAQIRKVPSRTGKPLTPEEAEQLISELNALNQKKLEAKKAQSMSENRMKEVNAQLDKMGFMRKRGALKRSENDQFDYAKIDRIFSDEVKGRKKLGLWDDVTEESIKDAANNNPIIKILNPIANELKAIREAVTTGTLADNVDKLVDEKKNAINTSRTKQLEIYNKYGLTQELKETDRKEYNRLKKLADEEYHATNEYAAGLRAEVDLNSTRSNRAHAVMSSRLGDILGRRRATDTHSVTELTEVGNKLNNATADIISNIQTDDANTRRALLDGSTLTKADLEKFNALGLSTADKNTFGKAQYIISHAFAIDTRQKWDIDIETIWALVSARDKTVYKWVVKYYLPVVKSLDKKTLSFLTHNVVKRSGSKTIRLVLDYAASDTKNARTLVKYLRGNKGLSFLKKVANMDYKKIRANLDHYAATNFNKKEANPEIISSTAPLRGAIGERFDVKYNPGENEEQQSNDDTVVNAATGRRANRDELAVVSRDELIIDDPFADLEDLIPGYAFGKLFSKNKDQKKYANPGSARMAKELEDLDKQREELLMKMGAYKDAVSPLKVPGYAFGKLKAGFKNIGDKFGRAKTKVGNFFSTASMAVTEGDTLSKFEEMTRLGVDANGNPLSDKDKYELAKKMGKLRGASQQLRMLEKNKDLTEKEKKDKADKIAENQTKLLEDIKTYLSFNTTDDGEVVKKLINTRGEVYINKLDPRNKKGLAEGQVNNESRNFLEKIADGTGKFKEFIFKKDENGETIASKTSSLLGKLAKIALAGVAGGGLATLITDAIFGKGTLHKVLTETIPTAVQGLWSNYVQPTVAKLPDLAMQGLLKIGELGGQALTWAGEHIVDLGVFLGSHFMDFMKLGGTFLSGVFQGVNQVVRGATGASLDESGGGDGIVGRTLKMVGQDIITGNTLSSFKTKLPTIGGKVVSTTTNAGSKAVVGVEKAGNTVFNKASTSITNAMRTARVGKVNESVFNKAYSKAISEGLSTEFATEWANHAVTGTTSTANKALTQGLKDAGASEELITKTVKGGGLLKTASAESNKILSKGLSKTIINEADDAAVYSAIKKTASNSLTAKVSEIFALMARKLKSFLSGVLNGTSKSKICNALARTTLGSKLVNFLNDKAPAALAACSSAISLVTPKTLQIIFAVVNLLTPIIWEPDAKSILGITNPLTLGQRIIAGVMNCILNLPFMGWLRIVPIQLFSFLVFDVIFAGVDIAGITTARKLSSSVVDEFNKATGLNYTVDEFNKVINGENTTYNIGLGWAIDTAMGNNREQLIEKSKNEASKNGYKFDQSTIDAWKGATYNADGSINMKNSDGSTTTINVESNDTNNYTTQIEGASDSSSIGLLGQIRDSLNNIYNSLIGGDVSVSTGTASMNDPEVIAEMAKHMNMTSEEYISVFGSGSGRYSQKDSSINMRYNKPGDTVYQDINSSGCGPIAATNLINRHVRTGMGLIEPSEAANYALKHGYKETNGGTDPRYFKDYFAKNGIDSKITSDKYSMRRALQNGQQVVLMGKDPGYGMGSTPYGPNPHYVVATGIKGNNIVVDNPEEYNEYTNYDAQSTINKSSKAIITSSRYGMGTMNDEMKTNTKYYHKPKSEAFVDGSAMATSLINSMNTIEKDVTSKQFVLDSLNYPINALVDSRYADDLFESTMRGTYTGDDYRRLSNLGDFASILEQEYADYGEERYNISKIQNSIDAYLRSFTSSSSKKRQNDFFTELSKRGTARDRIFRILTSLFSSQEKDPIKDIIRGKDPVWTGEGWEKLSYESLMEYLTQDKLSAVNSPKSGKTSLLKLDGFFSKNSDLHDDTTNIEGKNQLASSAIFSYHALTKFLLNNIMKNMLIRTFDKVNTEWNNIVGRSDFNYITKNGDTKITPHMYETMLTSLLPTSYLAQEYGGPASSFSDIDSSIPGKWGKYNFDFVNYFDMYNEKSTEHIQKTPGFFAWFLSLDEALRAQERKALIDASNSRITANISPDPGKTYFNNVVDFYRTMDVAPAFNLSQSVMPVKDVFAESDENTVKRLSSYNSAYDQYKEVADMFEDVYKAGRVPNFITPRFITYTYKKILEESKDYFPSLYSAGGMVDNAITELLTANGVNFNIRKGLSNSKQNAIPLLTDYDATTKQNIARSLAKLIKDVPYTDLGKATSSVYYKTLGQPYITSLGAATDIWRNDIGNYEDFPFLYDDDASTNQGYLYNKYLGDLKYGDTPEKLNHVFYEAFKKWMETGKVDDYTNTIAHNIWYQGISSHGKRDIVKNGEVYNFGDGKMHYFTNDDLKFLQDVSTNLKNSTIVSNRAFQNGTLVENNYGKPLSELLKTEPDRSDLKKYTNFISFVDKLRDTMLYAKFGELLGTSSNGRGGKTQHRSLVGFETALDFVNGYTKERITDTPDAIINQLLIDLESLDKDTDDNMTHVSFDEAITESQASWDKLNSLQRKELMLEVLSNYPKPDLTNRKTNLFDIVRYGYAQSKILPEYLFRQLYLVPRVPAQNEDGEINSFALDADEQTRINSYFTYDYLSKARKNWDTNVGKVLESLPNKSGSSDLSSAEKLSILNENDFVGSYVDKIKFKGDLLNSQLSASINDGPSGQRLTGINSALAKATTDAEAMDIINKNADFLNGHSATSHKASGRDVQKTSSSLAGKTFSQLSANDLNNLLTWNKNALWYYLPNYNNAELIYALEGNSNTDDSRGMLLNFLAGYNEFTNNKDIAASNVYGFSSAAYQPLYTSYMLKLNGDSTPPTLINKMLVEFFENIDKPLITKGGGVSPSTGGLTYEEGSKDVDQRGNAIQFATTSTGLSELDPVVFEDMAVYSQPLPAELNSFINYFYKANNTPSEYRAFESKGSTFITMGNKYHINPRIALAIMAVEFGMGAQAHKSKSVRMHLTRYNYISIMKPGEVGASGMVDFTKEGIEIGGAKYKQCTGNEEAKINAAIENVFIYLGETSYKNRRQKTLFSLNFKEGFVFCGTAEWIKLVQVFMKRFNANEKAKYIEPSDAELRFFQKMNKTAYNTDSLPKNKNAVTNFLESIWDFVKAIWGDKVVAFLRGGGDDNSNTLTIGSNGTSLASYIYNTKYKSARNFFQDSMTTTSGGPGYGSVTSEFGPRYLCGSLDQHYGIDVAPATAGSLNTQIFSPVGGTIVRLRPDSDGDGYGNSVLIRDDNTDDPHVHLFAHLREFDPNLKPGETINRGQRIGIMGNTGKSYGVHLHYGTAVPNSSGTFDYHTYFGNKSDYTGNNLNGLSWENYGRGTFSTANGWVDPDTYIGQYMDKYVQEQEVQEGQYLHRTYSGHVNDGPTGKRLTEINKYLDNASSEAEAEYFMTHIQPGYTNTPQEFVDGINWISKDEQNKGNHAKYHYNQYKTSTTGQGSGRTSLADQLISKHNMDKATMEAMHVGGSDKPIHLTEKEKRLVRRDEYGDKPKNNVAMGMGTSSNKEVELLNNISATLIDINSNTVASNNLNKELIALLLKAIKNGDLSTRSASFDDMINLLLKSSNVPAGQSASMSESSEALINAVTTIVQQ